MNGMVFVAALPYYAANRRVQLQNLCTEGGGQVIMGEVWGKYTLSHKKHQHIHTRGGQARVVCVV